MCTYSTYREYDMNICLTMRNICTILHITSILAWCYVMMYWWQLSFSSDASEKLHRYSLPRCSPVYLAVLMNCRIFQLCSKNEQNSAFLSVSCYCLGTEFAVWPTNCWWSASFALWTLNTCALRSSVQDSDTI